MALQGLHGARHAPSLTSGKWEWVHTLPLARDKIKICDTGHANNLGTNRLGEIVDKGLGHRRLVTFLRQPLGKWLLGDPIPRGEMVK